jgi:prepilin-type N-terminal cleavage/methylation domain-containing protein
MKRTHRGFSLVEVLVAMAVMATGLLAVATFQSDLMSGSGTNKARSEALALAQARIEQLRNFRTRAEFDNWFASTNNAYVTEGTFNGTNAVFTRKHAVSGAANVKTVEVRVEWTDRQGDAQNVALHTQVGWESPRSAGDIVNDNRGELVPSATGRAYLGEGTLPDGVNTTDNYDGTKLYEDGNDVKLVVGDDIVLTLEDACQTQTQTCIDFVKIKGKVYIDTGSAGNVTPGDVYVKASDAAYCHRYYYNQQGQAVDVAADTTDAEITAGGDYKYYNYTCYLGGGWHGNIGILLNGGIQQTDKVCQGDPTAEEPWADPVISARRVYRGMLYKIDNNNQSGKEEIPNSNHLVRYYSVGIADQTELPVPGSGQATHDFVISSMAVGDTTGDKCISAGPMVRGDSNVNGTAGDLFAGVPTDFVCLNPSYTDIDTIDASRTTYNLESSCPFDPSDPPTMHYFVEGWIFVTGPQDYQEQVAGMNVVTSDGPGNCTLTSFAFDEYQGYLGKYTCDIFDWGSGWTGYVEIKPNTDLIGCSTSRVTYTGTQQNLTDQNLYCTAGDVVYVSGSVDVPNNHTLVSAAIDGEAGRCTVTLNTDTGNYDYECNTVNINEQTQTWSGTITFTSNDGVICHANGPETNPSTVTYSNLGIGRHTDNFTIERGTQQCGMH